MDGYNVCIFAYGQTGSGKTFTIYGAENNPGLTPRATAELFKILRRDSKKFSFSLKVSFNGNCQILTINTSQTNIYLFLFFMFLVFYGLLDIKYAGIYGGVVPRYACGPSIAKECETIKVGY